MISLPIFWLVAPPLIKSIIFQHGYDEFSPKYLGMDFYSLSAIDIDGKPYSFAN